MKNTISAIKKKINASSSILVSGHINPDGDCLGSMLALGLGLRALKKKVSMHVQGPVPRIYHYLPGINDVIHNVSFTPDLAISVDCNTQEMLGRALSSFQKAKDIIEIDHHEYRRSFGTLQYIEPNASSVGEMVYDILKRFDISITQDIATNLMTSLVVESGSFRFPSVTDRTFLLCSRLMKTGVDYYSIVNNLFMSQHREGALLSGVCLSRCKFSERGKVVWSVIRKKDFLKYKGKDEDVDPVPDEMRSIRGVSVAILFREKSSKHVRVSLRSRRKVNVALLAEMYGGGGHFDVAGCVIANQPKVMKAFIHDAELLVRKSIIDE